MLARIGGPPDRDRGFAFHHEEVKILAHQDVNRFREGPDDAGFNFAHGVEHGQRPVFENRIGVEDEQSCFHAE